MASKCRFGNAGGIGPIAIAVEDPNRNNCGLWSDADYPLSIVPRRDGASHVSSMTVTINIPSTSTSRNTFPTSGAKLWMAHCYPKSVYKGKMMSSLDFAKALSRRRDDSQSRPVSMTQTFAILIDTVRPDVQGKVPFKKPPELTVTF